MNTTKKISILLFLFIIITNTKTTFAQVPQGINYQTVIRSSNGDPVVANASTTPQNIHCEVNIYMGNQPGQTGAQIVYGEKHLGLTTNNMGIVNFVIGGGSPTSSLLFENIDWSTGPYYFQLKVDRDGSGNLFGYADYGYQQLVSVPFALHAKVADSIAGGVSGSGGGTDNQNLIGSNLNGTVLQIDIEDGNSTIVDLSPLQDGTGTDDQNLTGANLNGTELQIDIEGGNSATVDLAPIQDGIGSDNQNLTGANLNGTELQIDIEDGNSAIVNLAALQDGVDDDDNDPTNELQTWTSLPGIPADISDGDDFIDSDSDPSNEIQVISFSNDTLYLSNGGEVFLGVYATDLVNDADSDPTNEIELPTNANTGDILEFDGNTWVSASPSIGGAGPGTVMYIYNGQICPSGWSTQQINVAIFGGVPVDACYTNSPCVVMYIYDGQSCPTGWTHQSIGAAVINNTTTPVDACYKCN